MYLLRIFLIGLIIYLLARAFVMSVAGDQRTREKKEPEKKNRKLKGVPRELGEYIDYEDVKK
jgi:hypothetical protein